MAVLQSQLKLSLIDGVTAKMRGISTAINSPQATSRRVMAPFTG